MNNTLVVCMGNLVMGHDCGWTTHNIGSEFGWFVANKLCIMPSFYKDFIYFCAFKRYHFVILRGGINQTGDHLKVALGKKNIQYDKLIAVCDDINLDRFSVKVSNKTVVGHRGIENLENVFGARSSIKIRIGMGRPGPNDGTVQNYVVSKIPHNDITLFVQEFEVILEHLSDISKTNVGDVYKKINQIKESIAR